MKYFLLTALGVALCGCDNSAEQKVAPTAAVQESEVISSAAMAASIIEPKSTTNSDGSITQVSSMVVCSEDVPKAAAKQPCNWKGSEISFYSVGSDFVSIDEKSLHIEYLIIDGTESKYSRKKEPNVTMGAFAGPEDDGKYMVWSINVEKGLHSFASDISFKGSVTAYKSQGLSEQTSAPFNIFSYKGFQLGDLKIGGTNNDVDEQNANMKLVQSLKSLENLDAKAIDAETVAAMQNGMEGAMMEILSSAMGSMFSGFSNSPDKDTISIPVFTTLGLERIELYDGSRKLKAEGWMGSDGVKYYNFEKPLQPMVTAKVFYWSNLEAVQLGFEL